MQNKEVKMKHEFDWEWLYKRNEHIFGEVCKIMQEMLTMEHHLRIMDDRWEKVERTIDMIWKTFGKLK